MLDVLLLTHNNLKTLDKCLDALSHHTDSKYRIFIFDNGSTDKKFLEYLNSITDRKIHISKNESNIGIGPGRRILSNLADSDYLMFLDSDMIVTPKWDYYMKRIMDKQHADAVSARFRKGTSNYIQANGGYYYIKKKKYIYIEHYDEGKEAEAPAVIRKCTWLPGGVMMITKEVNNKVKYLSFGYKIGFEDIDFSFQMRNAGFRLYSCPFTDFRHLHLEKESGYAQVRKDKVELLLSIALFTERWLLNPIRSWTVDNFLFKKRLTDAEIDKLIRWVIQNRDNRELIETRIKRIRGSR